MNKTPIFDLYTDYLQTSFSYTTATGLSQLLEGDISHDQVTRFLSKKIIPPRIYGNPLKKKYIKLKMMTVF